MFREGRHVDCTTDIKKIKSYGWYQTGVMAKVRAVLRDKIAILTAGQVPDNAPYQLIAGLPDKTTSSDINALALERPLTPKEQLIVTEVRKYLTKRSKFMPDASSTAGAAEQASPDVSHAGNRDEAGDEDGEDGSLPDMSEVDGEEEVEGENAVMSE